MSLTGYMTPGPHLCNLRNQVAVICSQVSLEEDKDLHECVDKSELSLEEDNDIHEYVDRSELSLDRRRHSLSVEDKSYSDSFHLCANELLAFWLFLVTSSYFLLRKNVNFFSGCRIKPAEEVSLSNRTIPNARTENDATAVDDTFSCFESSGSSHRTSSKNSWTGLCTKCDAYSEISDLDRESYWYSLLSLEEEEDSEWLSGSKPCECSCENPSTPLSYKGDSFTEISDTPSYWHSLLSLEEEDSEWLSGSKPCECSCENPSTPLSYNCDSFTEISDVDTPSSWHSLLSTEEEDSEWLSDSKLYEWLLDSKPYECSFENLSSSLSYKCDSFIDISDHSYWDSLLRLEGKDNEWISDSKQELGCVQDGSPSPSYEESWDIEVVPSVSSMSSLSGIHCGKSKDNISPEHQLETADVEEFSAEEPLFWPFEGKFNWNSEESWSSFCTSPRRRTILDSRSKTSRINGCEQKGDEALCSMNSETSRLSMWSKSSVKKVTLECEDEKVALKHGEVLSNKQLSLSKTFLNEDLDSDKDLAALGREYFALDQELLPIETLVGLKEFDGHEGLDSEFNDDDFMLEESLQ